MAIARWFMALSIRWKLQLGFFLVTMVTTIYNRTLASHELGKLIAIAESNGVDASVIQELQDSHSTFIFNSFWESGLEFLLQFILIGIVASLFVRPIKALCAALKAMEDGDLTHQVKIVSHDEIGVLERSFNNMQSVLNNLLGNISERGKEMGQSAYQIATISHEIANVSKNEQQRSSEVSAATSELNRTTESVQSFARDAAERAHLTEQYASDGIGRVKENIQLLQQTTQEVAHASSKIAELEQAATDIHAIVGTISSIAEQTNLLSLNAAIEAARAGEQGRGFAVVADEVRSLSQSTSQSLGEITTIIDTLGRKVSQVTATMSTVVERVNHTQRNAAETADVIDRMAQEASQSARASNDIADASQQQGSRLQELQQTLDRLFETLDESSSKVETTAAIGDDLFAVTEKLNRLMAGFNFEFEEYLEQDQNEKRRFPRAHNSLLVKVDNAGILLEGISSDFSLTGIQLRISEQLAKRERAELKIYLPKADIKEYERQQPLAVKARVAWDRQEQHDGREQYIYGMEFIDLTAGQRAQLKSCFDFFRKNAEFRDVSSQKAGGR